MLSKFYREGQNIMFSQSDDDMTKKYTPHLARESDARKYQAQWNEFIQAEIAAGRSDFTLVEDIPAAKPVLAKKEKVEPVGPTAAEIKAWERDHPTATAATRERWIASVKASQAQG